MFISPSPQSISQRNSIRTRAGKSTGSPARFAGLNLICCADRNGCFIQPMAQAADHMIDLNGSIRPEDHVHNHVAFNFQGTSLGRVLRLRLVQNRGRCIRRAGGLLLLLRRFSGRVRRIGKPGGDNRALLAAWRRIRGAVTQSPCWLTVPAIPFLPPVPLPYPSPPGNAGEPSRATVVACFGSPLPATPFGSPNPPVCTFSTGATTVAGAALPRIKVIHLHFILRNASARSLSRQSSSVRTSATCPDL